MSPCPGCDAAALCEDSVLLPPRPPAGQRYADGSMEVKVRPLVRARYRRFEPPLLPLEGLGLGVPEVKLARCGGIPRATSSHTRGVVSAASVGSHCDGAVLSGDHWDGKGAARTVSAESSKGSVNAGRLI